MLHGPPDRPPFSGETPLGRDAFASEPRSRGHDVIAVAGDREGLSDPEVMALARVEHRAVVTNNLRDYRPLHHDAITPGGLGHYGMIFMAGTYRRTKSDTGWIVAALQAILDRYPTRRSCSWRDLALARAFASRLLAQVLVGYPHTTSISVSARYSCLGSMLWQLCDWGAQKNRRLTCRPGWVAGRLPAAPRVPPHHRHLSWTGLATRNIMGTMWPDRPARCDSVAVDNRISATGMRLEPSRSRGSGPGPGTPGAWENTET
jgi:Domain of unknown function (DUF5615)